ncbi:hypothetical protein [Candidatus Ichthyocystis sparus]|uniref:hypothetical protein n=1 Tax=Candidatus Ichthyocystis sparus TaxID=1561004 RepID=UPI000B870B80|nr:hypothetical protein [Candidatus Ichthyocystis sparus]
MRGPKGKIGSHDNKRDDIWSNPARKSARSLKGKGQTVAATRRCTPRTEQQHASVAIRVTGIGPRKARGPGCDSITTKKRAGYSDISLCEVISVISVFTSVFTILAFDLLTLEDSNTASGKITGLSRRYLASTAPALFMSLIILLALLLSILSLGNRRKSQREDGW